MWNGSILSLNWIEKRRTTTVWCLCSRSVKHPIFPEKFPWRTIYDDVRFKNLSSIISKNCSSRSHDFIYFPSLMVQGHTKFVRMYTRYRSTWSRPTSDYTEADLPICPSCILVFKLKVATFEIFRWFFLYNALPYNSLFW